MKVNNEIHHEFAQFRIIRVDKRCSNVVTFWTISILMFRRFKKTKSFSIYFTIFWRLLICVVIRFWIIFAWFRTKFHIFCIVLIMLFVLTIKNRFFVVTYEMKFDEKFMRKWNSLLTKKNVYFVVAKIVLLFANSIMNNQTFNLKRRSILNNFQFDFVHAYFFIVNNMFTQLNLLLKKRIFRRFRIIIMFMKSFNHESHMFKMFLIIFRIN